MAENRITDSRYYHRDTYAVRLVLGAVALLVFFIMAYLLSSGKVLELDEKIVTAARAFRGPVLNAVMLAITHMADMWTIIGIAAVLLILDIVKWKQNDVPLAVGFALITVRLYEDIKKLYMRPRPDEAFWLVRENGFSFPSGHSMNGMFCYGIMIYLIWRNWEDGKPKKIMTALLAVLILLVPVSRVFCGVHYPSDVIAGMSLGFTQLMFFSVILDEIMYQLDIRKKNKEEA